MQPQTDRSAGRLERHGPATPWNRGGRAIERICLVGILLSCLTPRPADSQVVDSTLWGMGLANVGAMARSGNTLYVGGAFSQVGPNTGSGIPLQYGVGVPAPRYAKVNGEILAAVADGAGGWFIGGNFTAVGGLQRLHVAHILAGGAVADWSPDPNDRVHALALSGGTLYVGGQFDSIGGQPRSLIAAVDVATGQVTTWNPGAADVLAEFPVVAALAVRQDTVYVGGNFLSIGGQSHPYLAAVDARSGQALSWAPGPNYRVSAIALSGNVAYVGGRFSTIGGQSRRLAAAVDLTSGAATSWDPHITNRARQYWEPPPEVMALMVREKTVFVGGLIDSLGAQSRSGAGSVDVLSGAVTSWDPHPAGGFPYSYVRTLAARGDTIYVGGYFSTIQGVPRICLAGVNATTATPTAWDPRPNEEVNALVVDDDFIYAAGNYHTLGPWQVRYNLAAFDLTTGLPTDWNPDPDGLIVYALAVKDGIVYAGGDFRYIGGQARSGIAALDAATGAATSWNPSANGAIGAMVLSGDSVYVGGGFTQIGGQPRRHLAALDLNTGLATNWDPNAGNGADIEAMILEGSVMYVGGSFATMGPEHRGALAVVDVATGALLPWRADLTTGWVNSMVMSRGVLYVAGYFDTIAGEPRTSLAALDPTTGALAKWNPSPVRTPTASYGPPRLYAIAALGSEILVGGEFSAIGGAPRFCLAAVDDSLGMATGWNPHADEIVWSLYTSGSTLYVGGKFRTIGGLPTASLAAISFPTPPVPPPPPPAPLALAQSAPNPTHSTAIIHFALPAAGPVTLGVYDIQGRRMAMVLDHTPYPAGDHDVLVRADLWNPGTYFYRLEAAGRSATRKMLVVR